MYTEQLESCIHTGRIVGSSGLLQELGAVIAKCKTVQCMSHSKFSPRLVIIIPPPPINVRIFLLIKETTRLLQWLSGKESAWHCKRHGFDPWSQKIPHAEQQLSPRPTTAGPVLSSPDTQLLSPRARAPVLCNKRSHRSEKPEHNQSSPQSPQLEKSPCSNNGSAQRKENKKKIK